METKYIEVFSRAFSNKTTRENYIIRLQGLLKRLKGEGEGEGEGEGAKGLEEILLNPDMWYPKVREAYPSLATRKNILTAILVLFREDEVLKGLEVQKARWKKLHEDLSRHQGAQVKRSEPAAKQLEKYTSYEEIEGAYRGLKDKGPHATRIESLQYLLLSVLVHLRPKRADLGAVRIFKKDPNRTDINYIVLRPSSEGSSFLSMNIYKTSQHYKKIEEELPTALAKDIRTSLARWPREYLFVKDADTARGGKEPLSNNSYSAFVKRTFEHLFGRGTGVSLLRHIYISEKLDFDDMTMEEQEEEARLMLHTSGLQRQYKWPKKALCPKLCEEAIEKEVQRRLTRRSKRVKREGGTRRRLRSLEGNRPF